MKNFLAFLILIQLIFVSCSYAEWVNGYTRKDGTFVSGYNRSSRNSTVTDNYSYKGNTNPYTGSTGSNYYRDDPTSEYYGTSRTESNKPFRTRSAW